MRIQATREWKSHRITLNSAVLGEMKVTASVIHPSRPLQLKVVPVSRLAHLFEVGLWAFVYRVFAFSALRGAS